MHLHPQQHQTRPDDTKFTPSADPKNFFTNQFHGSDRFFDMGSNFDEFRVNGGNDGDFDNNPNDRIGNYPEEALDNHRKLDLSSEKRNYKNNRRNQDTEKMLSLRSKLFDNREPGGYYIKVFNNDGNNYSIKDGNFHKKSKGKNSSKEALKGDFIPQNYGHSNANNNVHPFPQQFNPFSPEDRRPSSQRRSWRENNINYWDQSKELSDNFPFLF